MSLQVSIATPRSASVDSGAVATNSTLPPRAASAAPGPEPRSLETSLFGSNLHVLAQDVDARTVVNITPGALTWIPISARRGFANGAPRLGHNNCVVHSLLQLIDGGPGAASGLARADRVEEVANLVRDLIMVPRGRVLPFHDVWAAITALFYTPLDPRPHLVELSGPSDAAAGHYGGNWSALLGSWGPWDGRIVAVYTTRALPHTEPIWTTLASLPDSFVGAFLAGLQGPTTLDTVAAPDFTVTQMLAVLAKVPPKFHAVLRDDYSPDQWPQGRLDAWIQWLDDMGVGSVVMPASAHGRRSPALPPAVARTIAERDARGGWAWTPRHVVIAQGNVPATAVVTADPIWPILQVYTARYDAEGGVDFPRGALFVHDRSLLCAEDITTDGIARLRAIATRLPAGHGRAFQ